LMSLSGGAGLGNSPFFTNPQISTAHNRSNSFRHGKLFSFDMESRSGTPEKSKKSRKVLWLCGRCTRRMTLKFVKGSGLVAVPLEPHRRESP
jgi:hypothetical protein